MSLKTTAFLAALLTIATTVAFGQAALKITGKIIDGSGKPLDGASVYLNRYPDSALVKTALAEKDGSYAFMGLKTGMYRLSFTMMGYNTTRIDTIKLGLSNLEIPVVIMEQKGKTLNEVAITAKKPFVEHLIDRTVVNPEALISNAASTAMDVLEKSPGVVVDQNGSITLSGKNNVQIFIDGKPSYLSGTDLESYLRSLSSSAIDQIELMTNPPAKYDAAGSGGVINIRTKHNKVRGFNGSLNLGYSQGRYGRTSNSLNFNYRNNKFNVTGNLSFNTANSFNDLDINRYFDAADGKLLSTFIQNDFIRRTGKSYNAIIGVDYYASAKTTLGINLTGLLNPSTNPTLNTSRFYNPQGKLDSTIIADNNATGQFKNGGINFNYRRQFDKKGTELTADLDYLFYQTNSDQSYNNKSYSPAGALTHNDLLTGNLPAHIDIYSAKTDFTHPLANGFKLEAGLKTSYTQTDNVANYFYTLNNVTNPDYDKTNHFLYRENINAAYINTSKDFKRLSVQIGLRLENTFSNGHQLGNIQKRDSAFNNNYTGLFPTAYLQYKLDSAGNNQLKLDYSRRIERPYYQDLNPFLSPLDKFTYYTGNPFLRPSYTQNIELAYSWKNITLTAGYSKTTDDVNETIEIVSGIYYSRPGNLGSIVNKLLSIDAGFDLTKWLNMHVYAHAINTHTTSAFYTGELDTQGTFYFIRPVFQFKLPHNWTAQLDGSYQSKITSAQFITGQRGRINAALSKKIWASTSVKLAVNDIFYNYLNSGVINNLANTRADWHNLNDSRTVAIALSYRFGKALADQRKHNANGAESEQNRVKN